MSSNGMGVIFDMDGVLVDSYQAHLRSWDEPAARRGVSMSREDFVRTFGQVGRDIIQRLWPGRFDPQQTDAFVEDKEEAYRQILARSFPEMLGAAALIAALHDAGFAMAIGSSGPPQNVQLVRQRLRNAGLIAATVDGKEVTRGKPDPEVFLTAARKLGIAPGRCAVLEDAPVGLQAARRAGMVAIGITGTAPRDALTQHATLIVDRLADLTPQTIAQLITRNIGAPAHASPGQP